MLEVVREGLELRRLADAVGERVGEHPVGEPGVAGEERAVEVRADGTAEAAALEAGAAVVPEPVDHAAQRLGALVQVRAAGMVLEAGERLLETRLELALEQDVADHAPVAGNGLVREDAGARLLASVLVAVEAAEQLVAAADGEQGGAVVERRTERIGARGEVGRDESLLAILAAADVEEIVVAGDERIAEPDRANLELVPAPSRPPREHGHVAAIGVDVQVVRVQVADDDLHR